MSRVALRRHFQHEMELVSMEPGEDVIFMCKTCNLPVALTLGTDELIQDIEAVLPPEISITEEQMDTLVDEILDRRSEYEDSNALIELIEECIDNLVEEEGFLNGDTL